jgi:hypothetical protein
VEPALLGISVKDNCMTCEHVRCVVPLGTNVDSYIWYRCRVEETRMSCRCVDQKF